MEMILCGSIHKMDGGNKQRLVDKKKSSREREGGGDRWRMCSGDICGSLYLISYLSLSLSPALFYSPPRLCARPSELSAAGGEWMANSYLGRRTRKREGGRKTQEEKERERARLAATFQRIIIVISLGGLDSVVSSRERKEEIKK